MRKSDWKVLCFGHHISVALMPCHSHVVIQALLGIQGVANGQHKGPLLLHFAKEHVPGSCVKEAKQLPRHSTMVDIELPQGCQVMKQKQGVKGEHILILRSIANGTHVLQFLQACRLSQHCPSVLNMTVHCLDIPKR